VQPINKMLNISFLFIIAFLVISHKARSAPIEQVACSAVYFTP